MDSVYLNPETNSRDCPRDILYCSSMSESYVYVIEVNAIVRYVGCGRNGRLRRHMSLLQRRANHRTQGREIKPSRLYDQLQAAIDSGGVVTFRKIAESLSPEAAILREQDEISRYEIGQLWNTYLSRQPYIVRPDYRERLAEGTRARSGDSTWRANVTAANRRKASDPNWIESQKRGTEARSADPQWRANSAKAGKARAADPQWRKRQSEGVREWGSRPEVKAMLSAANKRAAAVPGRREKNSEGRKANWRDPEYRAKYSNALKAKWRDNPEFRDKMLKTLVEAREVSRKRRMAAKQK